MQFLRNYVASTGHDVVVLTPGMECMVGGEDSDSESKSSVETDDESVVALGGDDDVATPAGAQSRQVYASHASVRRLLPRSLSSDSLDHASPPHHHVRSIRVDFADPHSNGFEEDVEQEGFRRSRRGSVDSILGSVGGSGIVLAFPPPRDRAESEASNPARKGNSAAAVAAKAVLRRRAGGKAPSFEHDKQVLTTQQPRARTVTWTARLASAVREGDAVVVGGIGETIPGALRGLLSGTRIVRAGRRHVFVDGDLVPVHPGFRLFLATSHPDPHFSPEAQSAVTLINFNLSTAALTEQLLAATVRHVQPSLSRRHAGIRTQLASLRATLQDHEDALLRYLADTPGDILADSQLIHTLETTREAAALASSQLETTTATEEHVAVAYGRFRSVAAFLAETFQICARLESVSRIYSFSLVSYVPVCCLGRLLSHRVLLMQVHAPIQPWRPLHARELEAACPGPDAQPRHPTVTRFVEQQTTHAWVRRWHSSVAGKRPVTRACHDEPQPQLASQRSATLTDPGAAWVKDPVGYPSRRCRCRCRCRCGC